MFIVQSNIWLHNLDSKKLLYDELLDIIKVELNKQKKELKKDMNFTIKNNNSTDLNISKIASKKIPIAISLLLRDILQNSFQIRKVKY